MSLFSGYNYLCLILRTYAQILCLLITTYGWPLKIIFSWWNAGMCQECGQWC